MTDGHEHPDRKNTAFVVIGILTFVYVLVELAFGVWIQSLTLLSDGFHNLSDVIALGIAYWAHNATKRASTDSYTYGWARTQILGGLTNGVFLLSLCLYITLEAIPRFFLPMEMDTTGVEGVIFMMVAGAGIVVNTIGTIVFCMVGVDAHGHGHTHDHEHEEEEVLLGPHEAGETLHTHSHHHDENVWAVFLHYLGDAVSSVFVLIAGALMHFSSAHWTKYVDPCSSLLIVLLIIYTTLPLVKRCSKVLLQATPNHISTETLRTLIASITGVESVHDLHVWQLVDGMIICSVHVAIGKESDVNGILSRTRQVLHTHGIHSSTVQPEIIEEGKIQEECLEHCVDSCQENWCCKTPREEV